MVAAGAGPEPTGAADLRDLRPCRTRPRPPYRGDMSTSEAPQAAAILDDDECWALLRAAEVGRLAVSVADHPDIFPVNFVVDDDRTVVFRTAEGTKLAAAVLGTAVAFEIDGYDADAGDAWSVVVKGRAEEIETMDDLWHALSLPLFPWHASPKHRFVRVVPDLTTGRRFHVSDAAASEAADLL